MALCAGASGSPRRLTRTWSPEAAPQHPPVPAPLLSGPRNCAGNRAIPTPACKYCMRGLDGQLCEPGLVGAPLLGGVVS
ncbi:unnamed protein product [Gadus morhua 'NCC']